MSAFALFSPLGFAAGFLLTLMLGRVLPAEAAGLPGAAIAESFIVNLLTLTLALASLPIQIEGVKTKRAPHLRAWLGVVLVCVALHLGVWAAPAHRESVHA